MNSSDENTSTYVEKRALLLLLVAVTVALGGILFPFYAAIMRGLIIALLFALIYRWLLT